MSSVLAGRRSAIVAVALAFTAAYTLAVGAAGGESPPVRERVVTSPTAVTALRDVARLPALRRVKPPAPTPRAPVATTAAPSASPSPTPMPVATATPPPPPSSPPSPPPSPVTPRPAAPQPTPEPTFDSSG